MKNKIWMNFFVPDLNGKLRKGSKSKPTPSRLPSNEEKGMKSRKSSLVQRSRINGWKSSGWKLESPGRKKIKVTFNNKFQDGLISRRKIKKLDANSPPKTCKTSARFGDYPGEGGSA